MQLAISIEVLAPGGNLAGLQRLTTVISVIFAARLASLSSKVAKRPAGRADARCKASAKSIPLRIH